MGARGGDPPQGSTRQLRGPRGKAAWERVIPASVTDLAALPEVLYTPDFAAFLRITPKAFRQRAARGQVPAPFKLGKALAWTRGSVLAWLRDCGRSAGSTEMTITRPRQEPLARRHPPHAPVRVQPRDPQAHGRPLRV